MTDTAFVHLCETCTPEVATEQREALQIALNAAGVPARVKLQACMNGCDAPVSLSLQAKGRATYFFHGVSPDTDCADIVATVEQYLHSPEGWITDARPCGRLRHCLVGRVPAFSSEE